MMFAIQKSLSNRIIFQNTTLRHIQMRNRVATIYQMWQRGAVSPKPDNLSCQCCYYSVDLHHKLSLHTLSHALFRQDSKINSSINSSQLLLSRRKFSNKEDGDVRDSIEPNLDEIKEDSSINKRKQYRLSKIISAYVSNVTISRNEAERLIRGGFVTIAGIPITTPHFLISLEEAKHSGTKAQNTLLQIKIPNDSNADASVRNAEINRTRVWLVHKLTGELVTENDPYERPSMLQRLRQGGVSISANSSSSSTHLKPIGRLDMQTEGLILLTNNGQYAHEMEHPRNRFHRTYRVRIFGNLTESKLSAIRKGKIIIDGIRYEKMKVTIDKVQGNAKRRVRNGGRGPANIWLHVTCTEGKNRMIRRVFEHLGMKVTRLIRVSYGDYQLQTIPPGMAIEVPMKPLESQKLKGNLWTNRYSKQSVQKKKELRKEARKNQDPRASPVEWVRNL